MGNLKQKLAVSFIMATAGAALAAGMPPAGAGAGWRGRGGPIKAALASLNLSADQQAKVQAIFAQEQPQFTALREQAQSARQALKAAVQVAAPDPAAVGSAFLRVKAARDAVRVEMTKAHDALVPILTPDQLAKFNGYIQALKDMRGRLRGHGAGAPPMS